MAIARRPAPFARPCVPGGPYHEGYLAAASGKDCPSGVRLIAPCPYPRGSGAELVWLQAVSDWREDMASGMPVRSP